MAYLHPPPHLGQMLVPPPKAMPNHHSAYQPIPAQINAVGGQSSGVFLPGNDISGQFLYVEPVSKHPRPHKTAVAVPLTREQLVDDAQHAMQQYTAYVNARRVERHKVWDEYWTSRVPANRKILRDDLSAWQEQRENESDSDVGGPVPLIPRHYPGVFAFERTGDIDMPDPPLIQQKNNPVPRPQMPMMDPKRMPPRGAPNHLGRVQYANMPKANGVAFVQAQAQAQAQAQQRRASQVQMAHMPQHMSPQQASVSWRGAPGAWNNYQIP